MKNAAMQHAIATATKKSEEAKKPTLSLSSHDKRSTDKDAEKAAQNMPEAAEKALQVAAQALHDGATKTASNDVGEMPRVVFRADHRLNGFAFLVDSMDPHKNTIFMYDLAHGGDKEEVPVDFYKTLKPMEQKQRYKAVKQLTEKLGISRIVVRDRLLKSHMLERDTEGKVDSKGLDALQSNLLQAVKQFEKAIAEAFKTV